MKKIAVLGSTGSIGRQTLDIVRKYPDRFRAVALSCGRNTDLLRAQIKEFAPEMVCVAEESEASRLRAEFASLTVFSGADGLSDLAERNSAEIVVNGLLGMMGIRPTLAAVEAGKDIAFANKETLVAGGSLVMEAVKRSGVRFLPVDSEHSAIFQSLRAADGNPLKKIILTASGGPFRGYSKDQLEQVTLEMALKHPNWSMGAKITVDSATMMNKGLEIIEASWLFGVDPKDIEVVVHPQSAVHSAVEFADGSVIALIGAPDMRLPIAYALSYPERLESPGKRFSFTDLASMTFEKPDLDTFKCLKLAYEAIEKGGSYPAVLNCSNEEAVAAFLAGRIRFVQIADCVEYALDSHDGADNRTVEDILEVEKTSRSSVRSYINNLT